MKENIWKLNVESNGYMITPLKKLVKLGRFEQTSSGCKSISMVYDSR